MTKRAKMKSELPCGMHSADPVSADAVPSGAKKRTAAAAHASAAR
jgi:hypothetical protein